MFEAHELTIMVDRMDYELVKKQIDLEKPITFGAVINVLLFSNRLKGCTQGLLEYLQHSTDITARSVSTLKEAKAAICEKPFDFLVIVGYLDYEFNYEVKELFEIRNKFSSVIIYAMLDSVITYACSKYKIKWSFDRCKPIAGLIEYMKNLHAANRTNRLSNLFAKEKTGQASEKAVAAVHPNKIKINRKRRTIYDLVSWVKREFFLTN